MVHIVWYCARYRKVSYETQHRERVKRRSVYNDRPLRLYRPCVPKNESHPLRSSAAIAPLSLYRCPLYVYCFLSSRSDALRAAHHKVIRSFTLHPPTITSRFQPRCSFCRCVREHARCATSPLSSCRAPVLFDQIHQPQRSSGSVRFLTSGPFAMTVCGCAGGLLDGGWQRVEQKGICRAAGTVDTLLQLQLTV
jgi:hypothetical protein